MQIKYRCPICKATNILMKQNTICRRCKSDLSSMYKLKQNSAYEVLIDILKKGDTLLP